ncbi:uncharacterized protein LOC119435316 [Dermacentor silvarum]|uniref:uncharacterized protein LOC119435316 n=1 Tax=Dermacentor silvarum TaxID=543639 RepID=UPI00189A5337|nr:uncharacterized protein LOC119435316 [Dermacentor silvarum]
MAKAAFNEQLIAEVEKRPILWNTRLEKYRDSDLRDRLWDEIAQLLKEMKPNADEAQTRWRSLRDTFRKKKKEKKDASRSGSASQDGTKKEWPYYSTKPVTVSNVSDNEEDIAFVEPAPLSEEQTQEPTEIVNELYQCISERAPGPSMVSSASSSRKRSAKERTGGRRKALKEIDKHIDTVSNQIAAYKELSPSAHFGLAIEPFVAATPEHMKAHLYMELIHVASHYARGIYPPALLYQGIPEDERWFRHSIKESILLSFLAPLPFHKVAEGVYLVHISFWNVGHVITKEIVQSTCCECHHSGIFW